MNWILIGIVAQSLITSTFTSKEACLGRVATLHEQKIEAKCAEAPAPNSSITGSITICPAWNGDAKTC